MLQVKNLTVWMNRDHKKVIDGLSFSLQEGDRAAIIGEEGNGKSTLLGILAGTASAAGRSSRRIYAAEL